MTPEKRNRQGEGGGRPRKWPTPESLSDAIEAYFLAIDKSAKKEDEKSKPPGLFALCVHADVSYECFLDYESGTYDTEIEKFSELIKKARLRIAAYAEEQIYERTAGATFQLVNLTRKMREPYKNAQHQELTGPNGGALEVSFTDRLKEARERAAAR